MGGVGSGYFGSRGRVRRATVESSLILDVGRLVREGLLEAGQQNSGTLTFAFRGNPAWPIQFDVDAQAEDNPQLVVRYPAATGGADLTEHGVALTTTRPRFGGVRWWFICPLIWEKPCNRRVAKLYIPPTGLYIGCRYCHKLTYSSFQRSHRFDSLCRSISRLMACDLGTAQQTLECLARRGEG